MTVRDRIAALRALMDDHSIDAYIIPSEDPHLSEYVAECWQDRAWISGFAGSAGTVVVCPEDAGLWTDFRYFLEAEEALKGSGIRLFKLDTAGVVDYPEWLASVMPQGGRLGMNGRRVSISRFRQIESTVSRKGISIETNLDLISEIWKDRPSLPSEPVFRMPEIYAGKSASEKLADLRRKMKSLGAGYHVISSLDDIAWLFNIRGSDVAYNPVCIAYAGIEADSAFLFIDTSKVGDDIREELSSEGIECRPYDDFEGYVAALPQNSAVLLSPAKSTVSLSTVLPEGVSLVEGMNPSTRMKAGKNRTEIEGMRRSMVRDGRALVRFAVWLEKAVKSEKVTELDLAEKLKAYRSEEEGFRGESFPPIVAYGEHGAVIHYRVSEESALTIGREGLLLIDSGAHFIDGTTDITRVFALGEADEGEKEDFTVVLKGHIALATARFEHGATGHQLDVIARQPFWQYGRNYGHGTGHGVGHYLNVHEGPQKVSYRPFRVQIEEGMIFSNEPGLYREGKYGIRIENLVVVEKAEKTDFGDFHRLETLSLFPIDRKLIKVDMLRDEERIWLNQYHKKVYDKLAPGLSPEEGEWLKENTAYI